MPTTNKCFLGAQRSAGIDNSDLQVKNPNRPAIPGGFVIPLQFVQYPSVHFLVVDSRNGVPKKTQQAENSLVPKKIAQGEISNQFWRTGEIELPQWQFPIHSKQWRVAGIFSCIRIMLLDCNGWSLKQVGRQLRRWDTAGHLRAQYWSHVKGASVLPLKKVQTVRICFKSID